MRINKLLMLGMILMGSISFITGCGNNDQSANEITGIEGKKYSIVCTTFPQYDWMREIIGEEVEHFDLTLLLDNSADLHNYQPTAEDIAKISTADMFVYGGGVSESWVEHVLEESINKEMKVVNLMEALGDAVKQEEMVEGMQESQHAHDDEDHEHDEEEHSNNKNEDHEHDEDDHDYDEAIEKDEHVWLSIKNASALVEVLTETLEDIDPEHEESYEANEAAYLEKLSVLDQQYKEAVERAATKTILFGDRFPFRYLADDYGLSYYAAFVGCSADTEASFETVAFLAGKVDELELDTILVLEGSDQKLANTIKQATQNKDQEILQMNSIQSVSSKAVEGGLAYLQVMQDNLEVLKKAIH